MTIHNHPEVEITYGSLDLDDEPSGGEMAFALRENMNYFHFHGYPADRHRDIALIYIDPRDEIELP